MSHFFLPVLFLFLSSMMSVKLSLFFYVQCSSLHITCNTIILPILVLLFQINHTSYMMECTANNTYEFPEWMVQGGMIQAIQRKPLENAALAFVQPTISIIGLILNSTFIYVVIRSKVMHTITNFYLLNLAIADSIFLVYGGSAGFMLYMHSNIRLNMAFGGRAVCIYDTLIKYTAYFTSLFTVSVVTLERYLAICHPLMHLRIASRRRTRKLITCCWVIGFCAALLMLFEYGAYNGSCWKYRVNPNDDYTLTKVVQCSIAGRLGLRNIYHVQPLIVCGTFFITLTGKVSSLILISVIDLLSFAKVNARVILRLLIIICCGLSIHIYEVLVFYFILRVLKERKKKEKKKKLSASSLGPVGSLIDQRRL